MELETTMEGDVQTDVCIIGAGPAGLVVAAELAAAGRDLVLLESGSGVGNGLAQKLNDGDVHGDPYAGLQATRHRGVGGTSLLWNTPTPAGPGAKYVPLDPTDFEPRWPEAPDGWPLAYDDLLPYYARAQRQCGLGAFEYDAAEWSAASDRPSAAFGREELVSRVFQLGSRDALIGPLRAAIERASTARLITNATALRVAIGRRESVVTVAGDRGAHGRVHARRVVLAAGAVENARLLLLARDDRGAVTDRSGWLGRGFMEHPRDRTLTLIPSNEASYRALGFYDAHRSAGGTMVIGRLGLTADLMRRHDLPNASATLLAVVAPARDRLRQLLGRAGTLPLVRRALPAGGHGWSSLSAPTRVLAGFTVLLNVEQPPRAENVITLGQRRDRLGSPVADLTWRWRPEDHARLVTLRTVVARALEGAGVGRVAIGADTPPDPNAHHHAGTTRMHPDPRHGVADADGRVHGTDSVYVAGASTFPTAGFANPMLTIVAMALRLAEHLRDAG